MALIGTVTLADIATRLTAFMDRAATIARRNNTPDDTGGTGEIYPTPLYTSVPCMVRPGKGTGLDAIIAAQLQAVNMYVIRFALGTDVQPFDQITVSGTKYEVKGVNGPENSDAVQTVAYCVEVIA